MVSWRRSQGPSSEQDRIRARAQQSHQETVSLVATADQRSSGGVGAETHDSIERHDEIGVDHAIAKSEAAVEVLQVCRHRITRQIRLVEKVERLDQWSDREFAVFRNSVRSCGSLS